MPLHVRLPGQDEHLEGLLRRRRRARENHQEDAGKAGEDSNPCHAVALGVCGPRRVGRATDWSAMR